MKLGMRYPTQRACLPNSQLTSRDASPHSCPSLCAVPKPSLPYSQLLDLELLSTLLCPLPPIPPSTLYCQVLPTVWDSIVFFPHCPDFTLAKWALILLARGKHLLCSCASCICPHLHAAQKAPADVILRGGGVGNGVLVPPPTLPAF